MTFLRTFTVHHLDDGGRLALTAFRTMATGADASELMNLFNARLGFSGTAALGAMHLLVKEIGTVGARRVTIACPGCCHVTADELSLVALLAAGQARDHARLESHVAWLLAGRRSETARASALGVGGIFKAAGLTIDCPGVEVTAPLRPPGRAAVRAVGNA